MNQVQLLGRIGQDPELRYTGAGTPVVNLRMATSESWTDDNGERQEKTEWHNLVAFGRKAEVIHEYVSKGDQLLITSGTLQTRSWEDREGNERQTTQVKVLQFEFVNGGRDGESSSESKQEPSRDQRAKQPAGGDEEETFQPDDELPF